MLGKSIWMRGTEGSRGTAGCSQTPHPPPVRAAGAPQRLYAAQTYRSLSLPAACRAGMSPNLKHTGAVGHSTEGEQSRTRAGT